MFDPWLVDAGGPLYPPSPPREMRNRLVARKVPDKNPNFAKNIHISPITVNAAVFSSPASTKPPGKGLCAAATHHFMRLSLRMLGAAIVIRGGYASRMRNIRRNGSAAPQSS